VDGRRRPAQVHPAARERTRPLLTDLWSRPPVEAEERGLEPPAYGRLAELRAPALAVVGGEANPLLHDIAASVVAHARGRARSSSRMPGTTRTWSILRRSTGWCWRF
jgi:hypothetical protein